MRWRAIALGLTGVLSLLLVGASVYAWARDDAGAQPEGGTADQVERGRALFLSKGCAGCHHVARKGIVVGFGMGPDLSSLPDTAASRVDGQTADAYVRASILNPDAYLASGYTSFGMPRIAVTPDELDALVVFLLDER